MSKHFRFCFEKFGTISFFRKISKDRKLKFYVVLCINSIIHILYLYIYIFYMFCIFLYFIYFIYFIFYIFCIFYILCILYIYSVYFVYFVYFVEGSKGGGSEEREKRRKEVRKKGSWEVRGVGRTAGRFYTLVLVGRRIKGWYFVFRIEENKLMAPRWHQETIAPRALKKNKKIMFGIMSKSKSLFLGRF